MAAAKKKKQQPARAKKPPAATKKPGTTKKKKPAAKKTAAANKRTPARTRTRTTTPPARTRVPAPQAGTVEVIGEVTAPSGTLTVFDVGLVGYLPREALEPALVKATVPTDRALPVIGRRVGKGRFSDCWDHVAVRLGDGEVAASKKLGEAGVDFARLVFMDHGAFDHWQHEDSLDGLADFVFWGRDAAALARSMGAPATKEGYGWTNLPVATADAKALDADKLRAANHWLLATDFRPHSHHFHALAAARKSSQGAGTIDVGGAKVCLFFTSWGDGVFPIYLDVDAHDQPVQIRVQLDTADSNAAMHAVNP
jgi:hypothetical protein